LPLPSSNYATATLVNPTAALTDFTLMVDLSRMPTAWWAAVDTADGTRGRAAKDDGTELACDWIDFNSVAETGWLRVKWSGTLAASGTQVLRVYPPKAANASVAAGDALGQYEVYSDGWRIYSPKGGDTNRVDGVAMTPVGGVTVGGVAGKVGLATDFDGTDDGVDTNHAGSHGADGFTMMLWGYTRAVEWTAFINNGSDQFTLRPRGTLGGPVNFQSAGGSGQLNSSAVMTLGVWEHWAGSRGTAGGTLYRDGAADVSDGVAEIARTIANLQFGKRGASSYLDGRMNEVQYHTPERPAAWIAEEYLQTDDQAAMWGVWTDNPVAGGGRRRAMVIG
jgi:hypothetical protein